MRHCGEKDRERRNNAPQCAVSAAAVANDANAATKIPLGMKSSSLQTTERRFAEPPSNVMALMLKQRAASEIATAKNAALRTSLGLGFVVLHENVEYSAKRGRQRFRVHPHGPRESRREISQHSLHLIS